MWHLFLLGMGMGLVAAAVPGPINLEVVRRALSRGPRLGFAFGMGAVTADVIFVIAASQGILALVTALPKQGRATLWLVGSILLFLVGINALRAKLPENKHPVSLDVTQEMPSLDFEKPAPQLRRLVRGYLLALVLTLTSPSTIMYWVFTSLGVAKAITEADEVDHAPLLLAAGVGAACTAWVSVVVTVAGRTHRRINPKTYLLVERVGGAGLMFFGGYSLFQAVKTLTQQF